MKQPRILFVDHAGVLGGAELYLLDVVRHLRDQSHVVLFEDGPFFDRLKEENLSAEVMKAPGSVLGIERTGGRFQDLRAIPGIAQMVLRLRRKARDFDVLFANSQKALVIGSLAGKMAGRPVIWNLHDILTAEHFSGAHRKLGVTLSNLCVDHIIVNSNATKDSFIESGGDASKTSIIYNGIDPMLFEEITQGEVADIRKSLGLENQIVVGIFSRLTPWKGQHILIEALSHLPDVHALLVGGALFQDDHVYERTLRNLVEQMKITDRVHFLGFRDDVPRLMKSVDIVLHSSTSPEPFGRVIVEGMFAQKPVIATNAGGAKEIIDDGATGLFVQPNNPMAMVNAINRLKLDPNETLRMAEAGYAMAKDRFAVQNIVSEIENQIRKVAGDPDVLTYSKASASSV